MTEVDQRRLDAIRDQLRCDGRRWTVAKSELVQAMLAAEAHLSARGLHEQLVSRYPQMDLSTVYRTLRALAESGVVHSLNDGSQTRYGLADRAHHHVLCADCGSLAEIPAAALDRLLATAESQTGYRFAGQSMTLAGCCGACRS
ncbi:Fur family transcriptional regulator [Actinoplanes sp. TFC3]|uniref:Fur family transcriptional regulator n=1 Tax=Actinoplanes sp. TFC3 TaxID=1710355 RepID=UPI00137A52FB|nr:Fur family transcriptional regulator [Actinoplanes sp. TFC3]